MCPNTRSRGWRAAVAMVAVVLCGVLWPPVRAGAEEPSPSPSSSVSTGDGSSSPASPEPSSTATVTVTASPSSSEAPSESPTGVVVYVDAAPGSELMAWIQGVAVVSVVCLLFTVFHVVGSLGR